MKKIIFSLTIALVLFSGTFFQARADEGGLVFTIIYDNYEHNPSCRTDWGFSCLVEGFDKTILFDTGTKTEIFAGNVEALKLDLSKVGVVVVSHFHGDHTGGMDAFFEIKTDVPIYVPVDSSRNAGLLCDRFRDKGAEVFPVSKEKEIMPNVFLTGTLGEAIKEQAMIFKTEKGLIVMTGCAHPGIVNILTKVREMFPTEKMALVFGGFHLMQTPEAEILSIIGAFKELGVTRLGATHCTGDKAIELFRDAFGSDFVEMGAGRILKF